MSVTIVLAGGGTGGHVFPMIAVAEALQALAPDVRLTFVGTARGLESKVVPERGFPLELLEILPIRGGGVRGAVRGAWRALWSLWECRQLLERVAPDVVFSVGGYAAGPVSLASRTLGIPVGLMEPNSVIGLANRLIAPLVQRAYVAFEESERYFRGSAIRRTGVPIRKGFARTAYPVLESGSPLAVLVLGGSQGAKSLNEVVPAALAKLGRPLRVVHQCGPAHADVVQSAYAGFPGVEVVPFIDDMPGALARAELVIGRAGASAVSEICAVGRPAVLVPYPYAAGDHQRANALSLERDGAAICISSADASVERLTAVIDTLASSPERRRAMANAAAKRGKPEAARAVASDLLELARERDSAASDPAETDLGRQGDGYHLAEVAEGRG